MKTKKRVRKSPEERAWAKVKQRWPNRVKKTLNLPLASLAIRNQRQFRYLVNKVFKGAMVYDFVKTCHLGKGGVIMSSVLGIDLGTVAMVDRALQQLGTSLEELLEATDTSQID